MYVKCENCKGHYKLKKGESIEDFVSCECGGNLKYVKSLELKYSANNKNKNRKQDSKLLPISSFFKLLYIISMGLVLFIFITSGPLIMTYSPIITLFLIFTIAFRLIINENNLNNSSLKFLLDISNFLIVPLIIMFMIIVSYRLYYQLYFPI